VNPGLALPELLPPNHPNRSALFLDVRRNKPRGWSTYFANQARHFANRSPSHALCCASSLVNYWPPRIVCPPSPFYPSLPHGRQPHGLLRVLENHSTSFPSATTRTNRGRRYCSLFFVPGDCKYRQPGSPATLVAASVHVAPSGRRRARDFSSSVRSLDINIPSRISVNEPYLLVPAHVCFSMASIPYIENTPLVIYILFGIAMRQCVSNPPNIPTTYPPGAHLPPPPPKNPTRPSTLPTVRSICSICIPNHHRAPFVMYHQFLYSLYAIAEAEYLCTGAD
jgi:hypothetical protein